MKWGVFSLSQIPDAERTTESFDSDMAYFQRAEALGYDTVWLAEHLFSNYGVVTSTQVYAAAVAARTSRIAIGTAVVVIPFNHPLRTASDFALVDVLSHGRLLFGAGRAYQPHEFLGLDLPMEDSRAMYDEGLDIVIRAWTEDKIAHKGGFWTVREPVEVLPKPVQKPHPPVYQACISPESFRTAARKGYNLQIASPFSYRTYRERWIDRLAESIRAYEDERAARGLDPKGGERMMLLPYYTAEDGAEARETFGERVEWFYAKVTRNQKSVAGQPDVVKGYELTMSESRKTLSGGYLSFDKLYEHRAAIADEPAVCAEKLAHLRDRLGITEFVLWPNLGGMPAAKAMRSMELTIRDVAPRVEASATKAAAA